MLRDAFLAARPLLKRGAPRWLQICAALETAATAGVPLDRLLQFPGALEAYARQLVAERSSADFPRPMSVLLCEEARLDAGADIAQADALRSENPATLHAVIQTTQPLIEHLREIVRRARQSLFTAHRIA